MSLKYLNCAVSQVSQRESIRGHRRTTFFLVMPAYDNSSYARECGLDVLLAACAVVNSSQLSFP